MQTVEAYFSTTTGLIVREGGHSRPATLDEVEQNHGQLKLDYVMSNAGQWVTLVEGYQAESAFVRGLVELDKRLAVKRAAM